MSKTTKPSEPQSAQPGDIHARIAAEAMQTDLALERPTLDALMTKVIQMIQASIDPHFVYEGRSYWVRMSVLMGMLELFAAPAERRPLSTVMFGEIEVFGHEPGH